jgi:hypothetical protein
MRDTQHKLYVNALIGEKVMKLTNNEKQTIVKELHRFFSYQKISDLTGVNKSTLVDWGTNRQDNTGEHIHISLSMIYRKIQHLKPENITDWGRIEMIKEKCEELLKQRK